jgi:hypothetical protein
MTDKYHNGAPQHKSRAFPISTFKDRDTWIRLLLAVDGETLIPGAKIVGASIALHLNVNTKQCNPPLPTVAESTGMSVRNVRRLLRLLEQTGWLVADQSSGGRRAGEDYNSNSYELHVPLTRTPESALNPDTDERVEEVNPDMESTLTRTPKVANPDNSVRPYKQAKKQAKIQAKRETPPLDLGDEDFGRRDQQTPDTTDAIFEEWWNQYPKKVDGIAARKAYDRVIKSKAATPAELMSGLMRYVAERQRVALVDGPEKARRYTKNPERWLNAGSWADEPAMPNGITLDRDGNLVRPPPVQHQQRSWMDIAMGDLPNEVLS